MTINTDALERVTSLSAFALARMADVSSPDTSESPGALWLLRVLREAEEIIEYDADDEDRDQIHESADQLVPIYNHERMTVLTDLAAYYEDLGDFGTPEDMLQAAGWSLYLVAERLLSAILDEYREAVEGDE